MFGAAKLKGRELAMVRSALAFADRQLSESRAWVAHHTGAVEGQSLPSTFKAGGHGNTTVFVDDAAPGRTQLDVVERNLDLAGVNLSSAYRELIGKKRYASSHDALGASILNLRSMKQAVVASRPAAPATDEVLTIANRAKMKVLVSQAPGSRAVDVNPASYSASQLRDGPIVTGDLNVLDDAIASVRQLRSELGEDVAKFDEQIAREQHADEILARMNVGRERDAMLAPM